MARLNVMAATLIEAGRDAIVVRQIQALTEGQLPTDRTVLPRMVPRERVMWHYYRLLEEGKKLLDREEMRAYEIV